MPVSWSRWSPPRASWRFARGRSTQRKVETPLFIGPAMSTLPPIDTLHIFPDVNGHLAERLRSLSPDDWHRPTMCSAWQVKDIAAHLLDTALRRLSLHRDGYASPNLRPGPGGLLPFLNRLNAEWTTAAYRLS